MAGRLGKTHRGGEIFCLKRSLQLDVEVDFGDKWMIFLGEVITEWLW